MRRFLNVRHSLSYAACLAVMAWLQPASITTSHASGANFGNRVFVQINQEGTQRCRELAGSGYVATASGTGSGVGPGSGAFNLRTCFATRSECESFIANLRSIAGSIDTIRHRACRPNR